MGLFQHLNCRLMLNWVVWNRTVCMYINWFGIRWPTMVIMSIKQTTPNRSKLLTHSEKYGYLSICRSPYVGQSTDQGFFFLLWVPGVGPKPTQAKRFQKRRELRRHSPKMGRLRPQTSGDKPSTGDAVECLGERSSEAQGVSVFAAWHECWALWHPCYVASSDVRRLMSEQYDDILTVARDVETMTF